MRLLFAVLAVVSSQLSCIEAAPTSTQGNVVCYFGSWAVYRYGQAKITAADIKPELCTHFIYTFIGLDALSNNVVLLDAWNDVGDEWKMGLLPKLREKSKAVGTKFMVALGGWNEGSAKYSAVISDPSRRSILVENIVNFTLSHKLDGFDIDWEYPAQRDGNPGDKDAFTAFCSELKAQFGPRGLILSAAVSANALTLPQSYDISKISKYLDMINVMAYDLHGSWELSTGHNAPLYAKSSESPENRHLNVDSSIKAWIALGADPEVLNLGLGAYGRSFILVDSAKNYIGAPATGDASAGWVGEKGFYGYDEICYKNRTSLTTYWDDEQKVPYAVSGNNWIGFDDPRSIELKVCYAKKQKLGGVMIWSIETDDFHGYCGQGDYPLLRKMGETLASSSCGSSSDPQETTPSPVEDPTTTEPQPAITTIPPSTETEPPSTETEPPSTETEPPSTETEPPSTTGEVDVTPLTEVPPETTDLPSTTENVVVVEPVSEPVETKEIACRENGEQIRDPDNCSVFYICTHGADYSFVPHRMQCSEGLAYDPTIGVCNFKRNVRCLPPRK